MSSALWENVDTENIFRGSVFKNNTVILRGVRHVEESVLSNSDKHKPEELAVGRDSLTAQATIHPAKRWEISEASYERGTLVKQPLPWQKLRSLIQFSGNKEVR